MRKSLLSTVALAAGLGLAAVQSTPSVAQGQGAKGGAQGAQPPSSQARESHPQRSQPQSQHSQSQPSQSRREPSKGQSAQQSHAQNENQQMHNSQERSDARRRGEKDETTGQGQRQQSQHNEGRREGELNQRSEQNPDRRHSQAPSQTQHSPAQPDAQRNAQQPSQNPAREGMNQSLQSRDRAQQGEGAGAVSLTAEQRTHIRTTVLAGNNVPRVEHVNFALRVGTLVPSRIRVVEVPDALIGIHPSWRNHYYFVVGEEIVIVDHGHHIVATVPVGTGSGAGLESDHDRTAVLSSEEVRQVQIMLRQKGFEVEVDGIMGPQTKRAVLAFQRRQGISATGQLDRKTVAELGVRSDGRINGETRQSGQQPSANEGNQPSTTGQGSRPSPSGQPSARPNTSAQPHSEGMKPNKQEGTSSKSDGAVRPNPSR